MQSVRGDAAWPFSVSADCHRPVTIGLFADSPDRRIAVACRAVPRRAAPRRAAPRYVGSADVSLTFCIGISVFTLNTPGMRVRVSIWKRR